MYLTKSKRSPFYQIIFYRDGKRTSISTKKNLKADAEIVLKQFLLEFDRRAQEILQKSIPLSQFAEEYISYCRTIRATSYVERSIIPAFKKFTSFAGNLSLHQVKPRQVDKFITEVNSYSTSAACLYYATLKSAFSKAVVWEYISENPFKKIKAPKQVKSIPTFISKQELQRIVDNVKHTFIQDIIITAFYTGCRLSELLNMRWSWINLKQNIITVRNTNGFTTKNKKDRMIPIHSCVEKIVLCRYSKASKSKMDDYVFLRYPGVKLNENFVSKVFKKSIRAADLSDKIKFHTLRHSFASNLVQAGSSLYVVKELLGHQDFQTTQIYSQLNQDNLSQAVNLL
jgi:site-specific recombinase XerD